MFWSSTFERFLGGQQTPSPQKEFLISTAAHSAPPLIFQTNSILCVNNVLDVHVNVTWLIYIQAAENPISPIMAEGYMSTEYKVTLGLRIYRACPSGIFFSEFICQNSFSSQFLSNVRSGEVTLLASTKSGSLLSPPPPHTSEPFFSSSNPRDFQLLSSPPPRISFAFEYLFSNPDNSDTLSLPSGHTQNVTLS